jgi:hypothetical protein
VVDRLPKVLPAGLQNTSPGQHPTTFADLLNQDEAPGKV